MIQTAEAVSLGHPDKTADYISSFILDRFLEHDAHTRYALEVMIKGNTVVLGGEINSTFCPSSYHQYVMQALREIGYDENYSQIWKDNAIDIKNLKIINLINCQSPQIAQGVNADGWGDQGVFVGYACQGIDNISSELYWARKLNKALYDKARKSKNLGLDIKTQISIENDKILTAIVAVPMLVKEDLSAFIFEVLGQKPKQLIINGAGDYIMHSSIADCGITGRKLAVDFYGSVAPLGGGSPWTKDATKADLTLNLYARKLALENLREYDEIWVYLSSCIGKAELTSAVLRWRKDNLYGESELSLSKTKPSALIAKFGLNKPIYAQMCREGLNKYLDNLPT